MPNTQNLATVGVTNRQDTDNIIVEQGVIFVGFSMKILRQIF